MFGIVYVIINANQNFACFYDGTVIRAGRTVDGARTAEPARLRAAAKGTQTIHCTVHRVKSLHWAGHAGDEGTVQRVSIAGPATTAVIWAAVRIRAGDTASRAVGTTFTLAMAARARITSNTFMAPQVDSLLKSKLKAPSLKTESEIAR